MAISERTAFVELLHQGNKVYHYARLHRDAMMMFDDNFKNKGFGLYVRPDRQHGFILTKKLHNVERLEQMILSVAPDADLPKYILALLEHGFYSIDDLNDMLNEYSGELRKYLKINRTGLFVHCP
jgi:hypothetical protein